MSGGGRKPNAALDASLLEWVKERGNKGLRIKDRFLTIKAKVLAKELGMTDFKASHGFIANFKNRHNIKCRAVTGCRKLPSDASNLAGKKNS